MVESCFKGITQEEFMDSVRSVADKLAMTGILEPITDDLVEKKRVGFIGDPKIVFRTMDKDKAAQALADMLKESLELEENFLDRFVDAQSARDELIEALEDKGVSPDNQLIRVALTRSYYEYVAKALSDLAEAVYSIPRLLSGYFEATEDRRFQEELEEKKKLSGVIGDADDDDGK